MFSKEASELFVLKQTNKFLCNQLRNKDYQIETLMQEIITLKQKNK